MEFVDSLHSVSFNFFVHILDPLLCPKGYPFNIGSYLEIVPPSKTHVNFNANNYYRDHLALSFVLYRGKPFVSYLEIVSLSVTHLNINFNANKYYRDCVSY